MVQDDAPIVIVGAGLAGLNCARTLQQQGRKVLVLERDTQVGGRVATSTIDGFRCDRGFQVLPSGDDEVQRFLPLEQLRLGRFMSGAMVRQGVTWRYLADPRRHPRYFLQQLFGIGSFKEKVAFARWIGGMLLHGPGAVPAGHSIADELRRYHLSGSLSELFIKPWLAGITLDHQLGADAAAVKAYIAAFLRGPAALPAGGMAAVPATLAATLAPSSIRLGVSVRGVTADRVTLDDGSSISASHVVVAADGPSQHRLWEQSGLGAAGQAPAWQGVRAYHLALPSLPVTKPWLVLPGDNPGPIASVSFPSLVAADYAPAGRHLATVAVLDQHDSNKDLWPTVQQQLLTLFGDAVHDWHCIHQDNIRQALPPQRPQDLSSRMCDVQAGIVSCGDCRSRPGIGAALASGHAAAEAVLAQ